MLFARDFRAIARDRLRGCFWAVLLVTLVAALLGGAVTNFGSGFQFNLNIQTEASAEYGAVQSMLTDLLQSPRFQALGSLIGLYTVAQLSLIHI